MTADEFMSDYEDWCSYRECHAIVGESPHFSEIGFTRSNERAVELLQEAAALIDRLWRNR